MKKAAIAMKNDTTVRGTITRTSDTPLALIAMSSLFSVIWPSVIIEASRVARGRASGSMVQVPHIRNSRMTAMPKPLPTSSSM